MALQAVLAQQGVALEVLLAHADGVVQTAPMEGVLHPTDNLDTLGVDEKESPCKAR